MATIKLTIDGRRKYNDGRSPIIFRLTSNTKSTSIDSEIKVFPKEWDKKKSKINKLHPDYKEYNHKLTNKLLELEKKLHLVATEENYNLIELKDILLNKKSSNNHFKAFALKEISGLREKEKFGNAQAYETAVNRLIGFAGEDLTLDRISFTLLSDFDKHLSKEGLSRNSVAVYMRELRALLNIAINKKLLDKNLYPFSSYKIKSEKTVNRAITKADIIKIKEYPLETNTTLWHCRNIFLLIFNLIGISFIDLALLKHSDVQGGRVVYRRRKTGKIYSIKITMEAQRIMDLYKNENSKFLISYLSTDGVPKEAERDAIALKLQTCNKFLKRLGKQLELPIPLTTYVARYTWANVAKSLGYPKDQIAEALGHEYGNRITGIYLDNYGSDIIDQMNEKVTLLITYFTNL